MDVNRALRRSRIGGYTSGVHPIRPALLIALAALGLAGCGKPADGTTHVTVVGERPKVADPATGPLSGADALLLANVAQGLVRFDTRGQIVPGLAVRWNVSDDGLSYIFRLQTGTWPSGRRIDSKEIARILSRQLRQSSQNDLKDTLGAVDEIVAMTERVVEIRLIAPRPNLLQLLAQPEFAILRDGEGSGPFLLNTGQPEAPLRLSRVLPGTDDAAEAREDVDLDGLPAPSAVARFRSGDTDLVLGGSFSDLPVARGAGVARNALRFDPVAGIFALVPGRRDGPLSEQALRSLIARALDRDALLATFGVEGLLPRTTLLQPGLEGMADPVAPAWAAVPLAERRAALAVEAKRLFGDLERPILAVSFPAGPGATQLFDRLRADLAPLGIGLQPAREGQPVDLRLIDEVAPSTSPAWFVRRLRCDRVPVCDAEADALADAARAAPAPQARAQLLTWAAERIDAAQLVIPLTAPIRWSLVSEKLPGFQPNRFGRHTLVDLKTRPARDSD